MALIDERDGERGVALVDPVTGRDIRRVGVAGATTMSGAPDGSLIAVGTEDGRVEAAARRHPRDLTTIKGFGEDVLDVAVDRGLLGIAGATRVEAWDISGRTPVKLLRHRLPNESGVVADRCRDRRRPSRTGREPSPR